MNSKFIELKNKNYNLEWACASKKEKEKNRDSNNIDNKNIEDIFNNLEINKIHYKEDLYYFKDNSRKKTLNKTQFNHRKKYFKNYNKANISEKQILYIDAI